MARKKVGAKLLPKLNPHIFVFVATMLLSACGGQEADTVASKVSGDTAIQFTNSNSNSNENTDKAEHSSSSVDVFFKSNASLVSITSQNTQTWAAELVFKNALGIYQPRNRLPMPLTYTGKIPDTGITASQCYGAGSDTLVSCTSVAAIALSSQQDGMIGRDVTASSNTDGQLGFSYSTVPNKAGGMYDKTECVKDNTTGLTWEGKTVSGMRSKWLYYSYSQASAFVSDVNVSNLCGFDDWRLPTAMELESLVDYSVASGDPSVLSPALDRTWFPNTQDSTFWSSSTSFNTPLVVGFSEGWTRGDSGNSNYVRLVRGAKMTTSFVQSQDGQEVTDAKAGLIWRRCAEGATFDGNTCIGGTEASGTSYSHELALARANSQAISTGLAWRLPNIKELTSLSSDLTSYESNFPGAPEWLWSSTPQAGYSHSAWAVQKYGAVEASLGNRTIYTFFRVRLVRNAP